jgi:WD40 repeat protein
VRLFSGFRSTVVGLAFSPDGRVLAARSLLGTVQVWERSDGHQTELLKEEGWVQDAAFTPEGTLLVAGAHRGAMLLWESDGGYLSLPGEFAGLDTEKAFLNGARRRLAAHVRREEPSIGTELVFCAAAGPDEGWRVTARVAPWSEEEGGPEDSAFCADGTTFFSSYLRLSRHFTRAVSRRLYRWDPATAEELARLAALAIPPGAFDKWEPLFRPAPDGTRAVMAAGSEVRMVYEQAQIPLPDPEPDPSPVQALAFSADGGLVAAANNSGRIAVWELMGLRRRGAFDWGVRGVRSLAFAPDGLRLAAGGDQGKIVVWDLE